MSTPLTGLPNPHKSTSPITFVAVPDVRLLLWSYRVLRSLQSNLSSGQLIHQPYYRPVSTLDQGYTHPPFLLGADHVFEWRSSLHGFPLCIVTLSINPLYHFPRPHLIVTNSFTYQCPHLHLLHWDLTPEISQELSESLEQVNGYLDGDLTELFVHLNQFYYDYFTPISPYDRSPHLPLLPSEPPTTPFIPTIPINPNTIPLVGQQ